MSRGIGDAASDSSFVGNGMSMAIESMESAATSLLQYAPVMYAGNKLWNSSNRKREKV